MFALSKLAWYVLQPGNFCVLLLVAGLALHLIWRRRPYGMILMGAGTLALAGIAVLPFSSWAIVPLENRFPQPSLPAHVDGIVVLGGSVNVFITDAHGLPSVRSAPERLFEAVRLARRYPDARIIVSGGEASIVATGKNEAPIMRDVLVSQGIDAKRIEMEERSRNTYENAVESYRVAQPKPGQVWILITSGWHMPRAVGCFRTAGWTVLPYPVDYRTTGVRGKIASFELTKELERLEIAVREWIGLAVYRAMGRIDELLPGPG
ncbi:MAG: YdcF family protein [Gemmatimonas sp.]